MANRKNVRRKANPPVVCGIIRVGLSQGQIRAPGRRSIVQAPEKCQNAHSMKTSKLIICSMAALIGAGLTGPAASQSREMQRLLENAKRVECRFTQKATGDWKEGVAQLEVEPADLETTFFDIVVDEGTAEAEGRFGASFIVVRYEYIYLHFMQSFSSGPLYVTSVMAQETTPGRLMAVQTRSEFSPARVPGFTSRPEMYLGDCAVTE